MRSALGWLGQVLAWLVILVAVVVLALAVVIPRLAGATPYNIQTGSMRPHYPPGTLVVVKPVDPATLASGEVATYQISSGEPEVATHRIQQVQVDLRGERTFVFKGDANPSPDPSPVRPIQIKGKLWYAVPYLGFVNGEMTGHQHQLLVYVVVTALFGYAAFMFSGAARDRLRRRRGSGRGAVATEIGEEESG